jgi:hypothetical protein
MIRLLQPTGLVVQNCKVVLHGVMPQPMFLQRFVDLVSSSEWLLRSVKHGTTMAFANWPSFDVDSMQFSISDERRAIEEIRCYDF